MTSMQPDSLSGFTTGEGHWHEKVVQVLHVTVTSDIHKSGRFPFY